MTKASPRLSWRGPIAILAGLLTYYLAIFLRYRPYDIDNTWFLSFSYNTTIEHIDTDQFLNARYPAGMDGTHLFGKLGAWTQWLVLSHTGWQQWPATILSACMVILGLAFWWLLLRRVGFGNPFIYCFLVVAGLSEPFVAAASKFRYEFLTFAMISFGMLLVAYGWTFLGAFLAALAVESGPAAIAGMLPIVILACFFQKIDRKLALCLAAALAAAFACYLALHHTNLFHIDAAGPTPRPNLLHANGFFEQYFLTRPRHWPELMAFLIAAAIYWRHRQSIPTNYFGLSALLLVFFAAIVPHGNVAYVIYLYPFLIVVALTAFNAEEKPWTIVAFAALLFLPQQIYVTCVTRGQAFGQADMAHVAEFIQEVEGRLNLPDTSLRIYGDYRFWYAHPHFYRGAALDTRPKIHDADLYLCFDGPPGARDVEPGNLLYCPDLKAARPITLIDTIDLHHRTLFLYAPK